MTKKEIRLAELKDKERVTQLFLRNAKGLVWELLDIISTHRNTLDATQREIAKLEGRKKQ